MAAKLGPHTGPRYRAKHPWQVRILLGCQQVKKHVAALKIAYCSFPIMLVSKTNEGMKKKNGRGKERVFCVFWMVQQFQ